MRTRAFAGTGRLMLGISLFWLALSALGDGLSALLLPAALLKIVPEAGRATTLGLLTFAALVLGMLVQPLAGALSDRIRRHSRWGRKAMLALGLAGMLPALGLLAAANSLPVLTLAALLLAGFAAFAQAGQQGFLPDLVRPAQRGTASGWKGFMDLAGASLGFALLGQALAGGEIAPAAWMLAALLVVTFLLTVILVRERLSAPSAAPALPPREAQEPQPPLTLAGAFRLDRHAQNCFGCLIAARFLFLLGIYAVGRFLLLFTAERLGLDPGQAAEQTGGLLAGLALLSALAAVPAGWLADRFGRVPLMIAGAALAAPGILLLTWADTQAEILLAAGLMSLGSAAFSAANWAMTADLAPPQEGGRYFGLANIGTAGAAACAGLFGPLVDTSGYPALFGAAALSAALSALAVLPLAARFRARTIHLRR